jgi:hypothetical protein
VVLDFNPQGRDQPTEVTPRITDYDKPDVVASGDLQEFVTDADKVTIPEPRVWGAGVPEPAQSLDRASLALRSHQLRAWI